MNAEIVNIIDRIKAGCTREELLLYATHANQSIRGSAIQSIVERFEGESSTIDVLKNFILKAENMKPAMGTISLSHLAMRLLSKICSSKAQEVFSELERTWPENDRADLTWFLQNG